MNENLKQSEKTSYRMAMYADGTADLGLGLLVLLLGLYPPVRGLLGPTWTTLIFFIALGLIVFGLMTFRKRATASRMAQIEFSEPSRERQKVGLYLTIFLLILTLISWLGFAHDYFRSLPPSSKWAGLADYGAEIIFTVIILGIFSALAYTLGMTRFYLYGMLLAASTLLQAMIGKYAGVLFLVSGVIITVIGVYALTQFLKKYPKV
jgi:hypothetical protein